jgi:hypothetical protein
LAANELVENFVSEAMAVVSHWVWSNISSYGCPSFGKAAKRVIRALWLSRSFLVLIKRWTFPEEWPITMNIKEANSTILNIFDQTTKSNISMPYHNFTCHFLSRCPRYNEFTISIH